MGNNQINQKEKLLKTLKDKNIIVWGARMTGIGFSRFLNANNLPKPLAFIDSDESIQGKKINGIEIISPSILKNLKKNNSNLLIVIAVALKEDDIILNLKELSFNENEYICYSEYAKDFYTIDIVGTCNLRCPSCAHGTPGMKEPLGFMSFDNFKKVINKALEESDVISHVSLYSWGEPLLHKELPKIIEYLHTKGIAVALSSNLSITSIDAIKNMIKMNPDYLKISTSGYFREAYEDTHTGGNIYLVKSNLYKLKYFIDKYNVSTLVDVNYHLYNNNCNKNLEKMKELCKELDFSLSTTYSLIMPLERVINHLNGITPPDVSELDNKLLVNVKEAVDASSEIKIDSCPFKENQTNINWDLTVPVCCTVYSRNESTMISQNYLDSSLEELNIAKKKVSLCETCMNMSLPQYNMGFNKIKWDAIAKNKECLDN